MIDQNILNQFKNIVGPNDFWDQPTDLALYAFDSSVEKPVLPDVVVRPKNNEEVAAICKLCNDNSIPLITRGAGTNLAGGTIPVTGGCVMVLTRMNQILEINVEDMYAVVQAGAITLDIASAVAAKGLFYPPDPGSQKMSTIGGT